ncbi:MAG: hypothetical protein H6753_02295 [Candidatus Omnitrophica bacterium]|nr:hypothetical protein [Candidatus Omnitrophota bacterium]
MSEKKSIGKSFMRTVIFLIVGFLSFWGFHTYFNLNNEKRVLEEMVMRLSADSRIAQVIVSDVQFNPITNKHMTTIKFLEYDSQRHPLEPKYFTFSGNMIQFQSLVVRFDDLQIKKADALRGKSVYLFWKAFILDGTNTQEYVISPIAQIPQGYKAPGEHSRFENEIWQEFWTIALDPKKASQRGIKNAQIEAPGTKFIPGLVYTIKIEHDGGMRIDASEIPEILKGEKVLK